AHMPPPGDEGFDISHEGGEHEVFEELAEEINFMSGRKPDTRTRTDRIEIQNAHWELQWEHLVDAYLTYRMNDSGDGLPPV
ncbi:hypothetical protein BD779DRAFT_1417169, partial [Infundibulicybe gibba]